MVCMTHRWRGESAANSSRKSNSRAAPQMGRFHGDWERFFSFSYSYTPRCINPDRYRSKAEHSPCKSLDPAGCTSAIKSSRFRRASAARIRARGNVVAGKVRYGGFANPTGNHRFRGLDAAPRQRARSVRVRPQSALLQGRTLLCRDRPSNRRLQPDKDKSARFVPGYLGGATRCVV